MHETTKFPRMETVKKTAVRAGRRFLVNVDKFAEYLNSRTVNEAAPRCFGAEGLPRIAAMLKQVVLWAL